VPGALDGLRVIDHSHVIAGSYCGRLLAELGAEVIKVEPPSGELFRHQGPVIEGETALFLYLNTDKKSVTLNLKHPDGKKMLLDLVKKSDVFIENYKPGALDKLGVGYEAQREANPGIVYASISGFGQTGPYRDLPAFDYLIQAMIGVMEVNGFPDAPVRTGPALTDFGSGLFAALSIASALIYRQRTGQGQRIDISMFDTGIAFLAEHLAYYQGSLPLRVGNRFQLSAPANVYPAKDGEVYVSLHTDKIWLEFLRLSSQETYAGDPRFATPWQRSVNVDAVDELVSNWTRQRSVTSCVEGLSRLGAVCGPVRGLQSLFDDPQVAARKMLPKVPHKSEAIAVPGSPIKMSLTPGEVRSPGPSLGRDNEEVYSALLGLSREDLLSLKGKGVI